ncbi:hypothetical protein [Promicromonospora kroppenstedtii]|uniref:hypothetical protein n=1 Tax=Promicromonospora kroppenstedtii TaxID=440482 RepID=UPI0004B48DCA|nr:hypothetical protein [Promicromonospora kroppenstedtii]
MAPTEHQAPRDGAIIAAQEMAAALTKAPLVYADGASQTFSTEGNRTTYVERGTHTQGTWEVLADGTFSSFWPPDYRAEYVVRWIVRQDVRIGISFTEVRGGNQFDGLYR